jgi:hypothetical protein
MTDYPKVISLLKAATIFLNVGVISECLVESFYLDNPAKEVFHMTSTVLTILCAASLSLIIWEENTQRAKGFRLIDLRFSAVSGFL